MEARTKRERARIYGWGRNLGFSKTNGEVKIKKGAKESPFAFPKTL